LRNDPLYPTSNSFYLDNGDGTGGFISAKACVNKPGFGYNGRVSQKCEKGTYNAPDTYGLCTACPYGLTTTDVGAGVYLSDCGVAPGFGKYGSSYLPCPIGSFNAAPWTNTSSAGNCTECPGYTTTQDVGADSAAACTSKSLVCTGRLLGSRQHALKLTAVGCLPLPLPHVNALVVRLLRVHDEVCGVVRFDTVSR
jgi:hypothetical protein